MQINKGQFVVNITGQFQQDHNTYTTVGENALKTGILAYITGEKGLYKKSSDFSC